MKKIFSFVAALLFALTLSAGPVSPEKALQVAGKFFDSQPGTRSGALSIVWTGNEASMRRSVAQDPAFYAINRSGGGWIIVAGDDNARPVLGFSTTGKFVAEDMPEHVSEWMKGLRLYCQQAAAGASDEEIAVLWDAFNPATRGSKITAAVTDEYTASQTLEWGQSGINNLEHFNAYCPWDESHSARSVTGCLPLAIAEIIAWQSTHGFSVPTQGTGSVGGYAVSAGYYSPAAYDLGTTYNWAAFNTLSALDIFYMADGDTKTAAIQGVSRVIADFGAALQAQYSSGGTGANDADVTKAFGDHFRYSKAAHHEYADKYSLRIWKEMLKTEIQTTPLLYAGQSPSAGGHAFVVDGYARYLDDDVFHFNFGWYGQNNGYYFLPDLDTSAGSDGTRNWAYRRVTALFGFVPDPSQTTEYASPALVTYNNGNVEGGLFISGTEQIVENTSFDLGARYIANEGPTTYSGYINFYLYNKDGVIKELLVPVGIDDFAPGNYYPTFGTFSVTIESASLAFGDYIAMAYLPVGKENIAANYVPVRASDSGQVLAKYPVYGAAFIKTDGSPTVGNPFDLRLVNAPYAYNGLTYTTTWTVTRPDGTQTVIPGDEGILTPTTAGTWHLKATVKRRSDSSVLETIESDLVVH